MADQLSPANQVMIAVAYVYQEHGGEPPARAVAAAAALRAAVDQVVPEDFAYDSGSLANGALEFEQGQDCRNEAIRQHILAIAAELKNQ